MEIDRLDMLCVFTSVFVASLYRIEEVVDLQDICSIKECIDKMVALLRW